MTMTSATKTCWNGSKKWWTEERIALALEIAARHPKDSAPAVAREFNAATGMDLTASAISFALWRNTGSRPEAFWGPNTKRPTKGRAAKAAKRDDSANDPSIERPEDLECDASEFDAIPQRARTPGDPEWNAVMPDDQRLKGNSTRLNKSGQVDQRWVKTERATLEPPTIDPVPPGHVVRGVSTMLDSQGEPRVQWVKAKKTDQDMWDQFVAATERHVERYAGVGGTRELATPAQDIVDTLTAYVMGDPHIGMLSWGQETGVDFDARIAERELVRCVELLVGKSPPSRRAMLVNLGDFFHAESDDQLTPHGGNKLDVDNRWAKVMDIGFTIMRRLTDLLLEKHEAVEVVNVPGNHDPRMSRMLALWMKAVYKDEPRVSILPNTNPYRFVEFGETLIGIGHGDGAKVEQLPGIMAEHDHGRPWGRTRHRYFLGGHLHQKIVKEFPGVLVEIFRTLAPRDYWAHHKGYRSGQSVEAITYDRLYGECTRATVPIRMVLDSLSGSLERP